MKRISLILAACALAAACSPAADTPSKTEAAKTNAETPMTDGAMAEGNMGMSAPAAGDSEATRAYKAAMNGMMADMPAYVGNPDIDFMKQMRVHHLAAIAMARVELDAGKDAQAKALAQEIVVAQEREIGVIDTWLARNGGPATSTAQ